MSCSHRPRSTSCWFTTLTPYSMTRNTVMLPANTAWHCNRRRSSAKRLKFVPLQVEQQPTYSHRCVFSQVTYRLYNHTIISRVVLMPMFSSASNWSTTRCNAPLHYFFTCHAFINKLPSVGINAKHRIYSQTATVNFQSLPSEIEVKYKIAECYTILKLDKDAIAVLDGIPSRQRTPKVSCHSWVL